MRSEKRAHERTPVLSLHQFFFAPKQSFQGAIIINTPILHVHLRSCSQRPQAEKSSKSYESFRSQTWRAYGKHMASAINYANYGHQHPRVRII